MSSPRNFLYRFPRFEAHNRVDFIHHDNVLLGYCTEISESGLRGAFSDTALPGTEGLITLYRNDQSFCAHAMILEVHENEATARFQFQSLQEENAIREFIRLLAPSEF
ncbi:MAG: PilZ domain-containing protein [Janthinobacterium lividum]